MSTKRWQQPRQSPARSRSGGPASSDRPARSVRSPYGYWHEAPGRYNAQEQASVVYSGTGRPDQTRSLEALSVSSERALARGASAHEASSLGSIVPTRKLSDAARKVRSISPTRPGGSYECLRLSLSWFRITCTQTMAAMIFGVVAGPLPTTICSARHGAVAERWRLFVTVRCLPSRHKDQEQCS
jgi:hypothetical protein